MTTIEITFYDAAQVVEDYLANIEAPEIYFNMLEVMHQEYKEAIETFGQSAPLFRIATSFCILFFCFSLVN